MRVTLVSIYARTVFLAGCFALALAAVGLRPQRLQSGPLEDRVAQIAEFAVAKALATGRVAWDASGAEPELHIMP